MSTFDITNPSDVAIRVQLITDRCKAVQFHIDEVTATHIVSTLSVLSDEDFKTTITHYFA